MYFVLAAEVFEVTVPHLMGAHSTSVSGQLWNTQEKSNTFCKNFKPSNSHLSLALSPHTCWDIAPALPHTQSSGEAI